MTPQQAKKLLPIITAFANGESIEYRYTVGDSTWIPKRNFVFDPYYYEYRIKPKETILYSQVLKDSNNSFFFGRATREKDITDINTIYSLMGHNKITLFDNKIVSTVFEPLEK